MRLDSAIEDLTRRQHACIAVWQLRLLGATRTEVNRLRASKRWREPVPGVLVRAGTPPSDEQSAMAAVLGAGSDAALSHGSAAAMWGLGSSYRIVPASLFRPYGTGEGVDHHLRGIEG